MRTNTKMTVAAERPGDRGGHAAGDGLSSILGMNA